MAVMTQQLNSAAYTGNGLHQVLDAINEVLESVNELPITTVPTDSAGASIEARALKILERTNIEIQSMGFPENTSYAKDENLASLSNIDGETLSIKAGGKDGHRTLVLRRAANNDTPNIWDADAGAIVASGTVCIDIIDKIPFHQCSFDLQRNIIAAAAMKFQRRIGGSASADQALVQERQFADFMVERNSPLKRNVPLDNVQSPFSGQQQQPKQQG
jgi:hypothetical protein